jgi:general nucleoside transport system permease protein
MTLEQFGLFFGSAFRLAMPLMLAGIGELVSETSGVLNLSLEGMMLSAALGGALSSWATGSPLLGLTCGIFAASFVALWQAFMSVTLRADQIVVGIGFNLLALGGTTFIYREVLGASSNEQIPGFAILGGGKDWSDAVPLLGPALLHQTTFFYFGLLLIAATWAIISGTSFGLNLRAVGEDPVAAEKAGVNVILTRYLAVLYTGVMAGVAGCFISLADVHTFTEGMTRGAGYLALAAVIFGSWRLARTLVACLVFGGATALQFLLPTIGISIPTGVLLMLPYVLALLAVAGLIARTKPPAALGLPFRNAR